MKTVITSSDQSFFNFGELKRYGGLLKYLSLRDVKVKYKQTWAGFGWAIIKPLINIIIFGTLAILIDRSGDRSEKFLQVSAGIIIWNFVSTLIMDVSNSMSNNANIISKVYFPKVILPVSTILVAFIDFLVSFVIFLIIYFSVKGLPSLSFLLLPLVLAFAVLVCFGLGLIFATASIKYRDAKFILPFLIQIFFYLTPVFISSSLVLNMHIPAILKDLYLINPFYYVVEGFKYCLNGHFNYFEPAHFFISVGITLLVLLVAMRYFYRVEKSFVDYL